MTKNPQMIDLEMIRHHSTEKAILVSLDGDNKNAVLAAALARRGRGAGRAQGQPAGRIRPRLREGPALMQPAYNTVTYDCAGKLVTITKRERKYHVWGFLLCDEWVHNQKFTHDTQAQS
jgi:hypothetical protein